MVAQSIQVATTNGADNAAIGSVAWSNPGNVTLNNPSSPATAAVSGGVSHYLYATNFGLALPSGIGVTGIQFDVWCNSTGGTVIDTSARLLENLGGAGVERANTTVAWSAAGFTDRIYGGPQDLWGAGPITASNINNTGFGLALAAQTASGTPVAQVMFVQLTVYFDPGPPPPIGRTLSVGGPV